MTRVCRHAFFHLFALALAVSACDYNPMLFPWRYATPSVPASEYFPLLRDAPPPPPGTEWPLAPSRAEALMRTGELRILSVEDTEGGFTGAHKLDVMLDGTEIAVKWKRSPDGDADGWNDSPRKELATYRIQQWWLDEADYIVPTIVLRCVPESQLQEFLPDQTANLPGVECVFGSLSVWLRDVEFVEKFYDPERFARDPRYAHHVANLNLLTYLIDHRDSKPRNFLVSTNPENPRIFSIDNGISFGSLLYNIGVLNWNRIRVPMLRRESIERLRAIERRDVESLATLRAFAVDGRELRPVDGDTAGTPEDSLILLGLTEPERNDLWERVQTLIRRVDTGQLLLF